MWGQWDSVDNSVAGIPASFWANAVIKHFDAAPEAELKQTVL